MTGENEAWRYRAFIAYSHRDKRRAAWLHRRLEFYRVPRRLIGRKTGIGEVPRRLGPVFRDREELASAEDLGERIDRALEQSEALIVVCSPAAARSRWVNEEVLRFQQSGRKHRIFCLIVSGKPGAAGTAGHENEECLPPALRYRADGQGEVEVVEPLAADIRPGGDGRGLALLKLVAGLLDVGLDELRRRELQRRNRRWAGVTALALVVMASTSLLALEATFQRNAAERQRAQAEGLVGFMLGNLLTELEPIGRLDLLDMVGKRALAYYEKQNPDSLDADSLARRAHALRVIGEVYDRRGNLDAALPVFKQAAATTARLLAQDPHDPQRLFNHAQSVYFLGEIAWERGHPTRAEAEFKHYRTLAERLVKIDPDNPKWQTELGYSYSNLATALLAENKVAEAASAIRKSLAISIRLARKAPRDANKQYDMAQSRAWLADTEVRLGLLDDAYTQRSAERAVYLALLKQDSTNDNARESLAVSDRALANLLIARGDLNGALKRIEAAVNTADALVTKDSSNTLRQGIDASAYASLGEILYYRNDDAAASKALVRAKKLSRTLVERDPSVVGWQAVLARTQLLEAMLAARTGNHQDALALIHAAATRLATLLEKHPEYERAKGLLARTHLLEGDVLHALGRADCTKAWTNTLQTLGPGSGAYSPPTRTAMALAYLRLGETARAQDIARQLDALGYRAPEFMQLKEALRLARKRHNNGRTQGSRTDQRPVSIVPDPM